MKTLRKILLGAAIVAMATAGTLYAQTAPSGGGADEPDTSVPMTKETQLSPGEMTARAKVLQGEMEANFKYITDLKIRARKQKDVIKLNCINDKFLQIKALMNIAEGAQMNLEVAIMGRDDEARFHEFSKVTISAEKVQALRNEAEACIGEELTYVGPLDVEVDAPEIPDDPTATDPFGEGIEPPAYESPFS
jgi:hypothetical protein